MIVMVDNEPSAVLETRMQFYTMGIHTAVIPTTQLAEIDHYPTQTVLIARPECIEDLEAVCRTIRTYGKPLALLYRPPHGNFYAYKQLCDEVFEDEVTTARFVETMFAIYEERFIRSAFERQFADLRINVRQHCLYIRGEAFPATHEQWMLARYLLLRAPLPAPAEELRQTCFRPEWLPSVKNVSTQICRMNKLIQKGFGRPLFFYQRKTGYFISQI